MENNRTPTKSLEQLKLRNQTLTDVLRELPTNSQTFDTVAQLLGLAQDQIGSFEQAVTETCRYL